MIEPASRDSLAIPTIDAVHLSKQFGTTVALQDFSATVKAGEIFGLVGPGGSGKSTVLRLLAGLMAPDAGHAAVAGCSTTADSLLLKEKISYMSQRFGLYPDLTILENIDFYAELFHVPKRHKRAKIAELLELSGLAPFADRQAGRLSGGMKQKLALSCALVHAPQVLLLDEPTNGVDPISRRDFWRILYQLLAAGATIFLTTSYLDEAERCTKIGLLHNGRIVAQGTPAAVKKQLPGTLFAVELAQPRQALPLLRRQLQPASLNLFGAKMHLLLDAPAETATKSLTEALAALNLSAQYTVIEPSLEDVFLALLEPKQEG